MRVAENAAKNAAAKRQPMQRPRSMPVSVPDRSTGSTVSPSWNADIGAGGRYCFRSCGPVPNRRPPAGAGLTYLKLTLQQLRAKWNGREHATRLSCALPDRVGGTVRAPTAERPGPKRRPKARDRKDGRKPGTEKTADHEALAGDEAGAGGWSEAWFGASKYFRAKPHHASMSPCRMAISVNSDWLATLSFCLML